MVFGLKKEVSRTYNSKYGRGALADVQWSFQFSILLPATLATSDWHAFGRVSYMITARVQGIPYTSFSSIFKAITPPAFEHTYAADFERVMARSEKTAAERSKRPSSRDNSVPRNSGSKSRDNIATVANSSLNEDYDVDDSGSHGQGLYTRRHSHLPIDESSRGRLKWHKPGSSGSDKIDKTDWMKGDLVASRELLVHAVSPVTGGVTSLDLRKEGFVDGLGSWTLSASADVVRFLPISVALLILSLICANFFPPLWFNSSPLHLSSFSPLTSPHPLHPPQSSSSVSCSLNHTASPPHVPLTSRRIYLKIPSNTSSTKSGLRIRKAVITRGQSMKPFGEDMKLVGKVGWRVRIKDGK